MTVLLNAQREISDKILDAQWETKWRQDKVGGFCLSISCLPLCLFMVKGSTDQNRHMSLSGISCNEIMLNSICKLSQDHTLCFVSSQCSWYSWFLLQNSGCKAICGLLSCTQTANCFQNYHMPFNIYSICQILYYSSLHALKCHCPSIFCASDWCLISPTVEWDVGGKGEALHSGYRQCSSSWAYFIKASKSGKGLSFSVFCLGLDIHWLCMLTRIGTHLSIDIVFSYSKVEINEDHVWFVCGRLDLLLTSN